MEEKLSKTFENHINRKNLNQMSIDGIEEEIQATLSNILLNYTDENIKGKFF